LINCFLEKSRPKSAAKPRKPRLLRKSLPNHFFLKSGTKTLIAKPRKPRLLRKSLPNRFLRKSRPKSAALPRTKNHFSGKAGQKKCGFVAQTWLFYGLCYFLYKII